MKAAIFFILLTLSFAFVPESQFLKTPTEDINNTILEENLAKPHILQRQNALVFPLSDSEDTDLITSDSDTFQVDQTYFQGLNSSFTDLYNEWNKKSSDSENEDFDQVYNEALWTLSLISNETIENKTLLGLAKTSVRDLLKITEVNFDEMFDELAQLTGQTGEDKTIFGVDKDTIKESFAEVEENFDEIFDGVVSLLVQLSQEGAETNTIFGFDKAAIKKLFDSTEESIEQILHNSLNINEPDSFQANWMNSTNGYSNKTEEDFDEVLFALRQLFNETVEEKALFGDTSDSDDFQIGEEDSNLTAYIQNAINEYFNNSKVDTNELAFALNQLLNGTLQAKNYTNETDSFQVNNTYFNDLGFNWTGNNVQMDSNGTNGTDYYGGYDLYIYDIDFNTTFSNQNLTDNYLNNTEIDFDQILNAIAQLFNETLEGQEYFDSQQNKNLGSNETDSFEGNDSYFNELNSNLTQNVTSEYSDSTDVDLEGILAAFGQVIDAAMRENALLGSEQSDD